MDLELELFGDAKDNKTTSNNQGSSTGTTSAAIGKVFMLSLSSQPVDHEDPAGRAKVRINRFT